MTALDIPEDWTLVSELATKHGLASADVLELLEHAADIQQTSEDGKLYVCRLQP